MTDAHDRRTLASLLAIFYNEQIFEEGYAFSPAPGCEGYCAPAEGPIESYIGFIRGLPATAPPEVGAWGAETIAWHPACWCCQQRMGPSWRPWWPVNEGWLPPCKCPLCLCCLLTVALTNVRLCCCCQVYGLHSNADITKDQQETNQLLDSLLASQGSGGGGGGGATGGAAAASRDSLLLQLAAELDGRLRAPFDIEAARYK